MDDLRPPGELRRGWTTGACAAAAAKAAYVGWIAGEFPDPVEIRLPSGGAPGLRRWRCMNARATAPAPASSKDAGDDLDVTHGALVVAAVRPAPAGQGVVFRAGPGVGVVTRAACRCPSASPPSTRFPVR